MDDSAFHGLIDELRAAGFSPIIIDEHTEFPPMSILRVVVIDPEPRDSNDVIVYQVPEHSRAYALLVDLLDGAGIEHVELESKPRTRKPQLKGPQDENSTD